MLKNDLLMKALRGEKVVRPPVWMMRQAGRYLPEFMELKDQYDFFTRCQTPEMAAEITLMPIKRFPLDAAILFSDILVVPQAMGLPFVMKPNVGPFLENPVRNLQEITQLKSENAIQSLQYVFDAIDLTLKELDNKIPLLGFAGSPWTILCYAVEGKGSKAFDIAKSFCFQNPKAAHLLLEKITKITIDYLLEKAKHGVSAVQIFDSWGGLLSPKDYKEFSWQYINEIIEKVSEKVPVIVYGKGCWFALEEMAQSKASAIGVDWTITPKKAREFTRNAKTLQGNFDPAKLLSSPEIIYRETQQMITDFGVGKYIANLGHGILPNVPLQNAEAFVAAVVDYV